MTTVTIVLPGSQWEVHPDEVDSLVDRLSAAAAADQTVTVQVVDDSGAPATAFVAPSRVAVVVIGEDRRVPDEGFAEMGFPEHLVPDLPR